MAMKLSRSYPVCIKGVTAAPCGSFSFAEKLAGTMEIWYKSDRFKRASDNEITAEVNFPGESPWFDGHFPQEPILPGIAQVAVAHDLIRRAFGADLPLREINRIRFKRKISPFDRLTVTIAPVDGSAETYRFRMTCGDEPVCSGLLKTGIIKEND